jgi:hypothetical protein
MNWRKLPHPTYGNYGGRKQVGGEFIEPIDWMDEAFRLHDLELYFAGFNSTLRDQADCNLVRRLLEGDSNKLKRPIYGRLYRHVATLIFAIACTRL